MSYRRRFEQLIAELKARPEITVKEARLGPPTEPAELGRWRARAGAAWPEAMTLVYSELSSVDIEYQVEGSCGGAIHLPPLSSIWSYDDLKDELWFDFLPKDHPFHSIRPIDRFVPEAYAVLYPVPGDRPAQVHYHYCGESLVPTGLAYHEWLELLFRSRGAFYWLQLTLAPDGGSRTWVDEGIERIASLFPDFAPARMRPKTAFAEIDI